MKRLVHAGIIVCVLILSVLRATAQTKYVPELGSKVPLYILKANTGSRHCLTDIAHRDPCTSLTIQKNRFTVAWDAQTKEITYLFTDDRDLIMDSELSVGGQCRLVDQDGKPFEISRYMGWLITKA